MWRVCFQHRARGLINVKRIVVRVMRRKKRRGYELSPQSGHGGKRPALWERTSKNQALGAVDQSRYTYNLGEVDG